MRKRWGVATLAAGMALTATACGSDDDDASGGRDVTVALPFPSCLSWWPLYAAEEQGFFEEAGISTTFQGVDGSSAAIQATQANRAEMALSAPDNYLAASAQGADLRGWYAFYQAGTFHVVAPADSDIAGLDDLEGRTLGISTPGGGDVTYAQTLLKLGADLDADEDYEQLAVGDGSSAATALQSGAVDAYSASYFDQEVIESGGIELIELTSDDYPAVVGLHFVSTTEWFEGNGDVVDDFGRAVARGTDWGLENRDAVIELCGQYAPEETEDPEFAAVIFDRVAELVALPESAGGSYGQIDEQAWDDYRDLLIDLEIVPGEASDVGVDNEHVDAWNED